MDWDEYFIKMSELVATKSKDRSTKVGCVIVGENHEVKSTGYNGFCRGVNDHVEERYYRPEKLFWTEHAERNAVYNAARNGISLDKSTAYVTPLFPCADCARALIQSGIKRIVAPHPIESSTWTESFNKSLVMFEESGIEMKRY
jgi:dCMP deaminase